ncbi:MAG: CvpA family protein, partial [Actinomycetota bacterium]
MNWVDLGIIAGLGLAIWTGYRRGAILQLFSWGGFVSGILIGALVAPPIVHTFDPKDPTTRAIVGLAVFLGVAFVIEAIIAFGGSRVASRITAARVQQSDRRVGGGVAAVLLILAAWLVSLPAKHVPALAKSVSGSAILRGTYSALGTPPNI